MNFAKPCLDVGLNISGDEAALRFWREEVGLAYEGPLPIRRGVTQHREADYLFQDDLRRVAELTEGRALLDAAGLSK